jgi:alpha-tubulin suppressor-like RCC1 family protein
MVGCVGLLSVVGCVADAPPQHVTAVPGDGRVTVSWEPPLGVPAHVIGYGVIPYVGNESLPEVRFESTALTQTVTGLTNGVAYRFSVYAISDTGGDSALSEPSDEVTPAALPISAGGNHTCAVVGGGGVKCWGYNGHGQLGNGTTSDASSAVAVTGISSAVTIAAGGRHTCAVTTDGSVWCWGGNDQGQLGNGTTSASSTPVEVNGIENVTDVSAGGLSTCARHDDGTVSCWGWNNQGQLGNGTTMNSSTPVPVTGISTAVTVGAADLHTCARLAEGTVACWGDNVYGQLGDGTTNDASTPVTVVGISDAINVSDGGDHTCAVLDDHTVRCWGNNGYGQLGNGETSQGLPNPVPQTVVGMTNVVEVTTGGSIASYYTCALTLFGTVSCWGENDQGQLGNGTFSDTVAPMPVSGGGSIPQVTAGGYAHTCHRRINGGARCWGFNENGQLGNGTTTTSPTPVVVVGL